MVDWNRHAKDRAANDSATPVSSDEMIEMCLQYARREMALSYVRTTLMVIALLAGMASMAVAAYGVGVCQ